MTRRKISVLVLMILVMLWAMSVFAQQVSPEEGIGREQADEKIVASPKDIKEKTAICVFLGWMWLLIIVLIFIFRSKIKEVDRLHLIKFFSNQKK